MTASVRFRHQLPSAVPHGGRLAAGEPADVYIDAAFVTLHQWCTSNHITGYAGDRELISCLSSASPGYGYDLAGRIRVNGNSCIGNICHDNIIDIRLTSVPLELV